MCTLRRKSWSMMNSKRSITIHVDLLTSKQCSAFDILSALKRKKEKENGKKEKDNQNKLTKAKIYECCPAFPSVITHSILHLGKTIMLVIHMIV